MKKYDVRKGLRVKYQPLPQDLPDFPGATVEIASDSVTWYQVPGLRPSTSEGHRGVLVRHLNAKSEPINSTFVSALHNLFLIEDGDT